MYYTGYYTPQDVLEGMPTYAVAEAGAIRGATITAAVTFMLPSTLPVMLTNAIFCVSAFDMPTEEHASSFQIYYLNVSPLHLLIF